MNFQIIAIGLEEEADSGGLSQEAVGNKINPMRYPGKYLKEAAISEAQTRAEGMLEYPEMLRW